MADFNNPVPMRRALYGRLLRRLLRQPKNTPSDRLTLICEPRVTLHISFFFVSKNSKFRVSKESAIPLAHLAKPYSLEQSAAHRLCSLV